MFNGNYIKLDVMLGLLAKYPFTEGITKREVAHALVDLLRQTGATTPLKREFQTIKINQHKGELPQGIVYIHGVRNLGLLCNSDGIPMNYASDIWHSSLHSKAAKAECAGQRLDTSTYESLYGPKAQYDYKETGGVLETSLHAWQVGDDVPRGFAENSYNINGSSIDTSFPTGYVSIAYDKIMSDSEGFPMIPDNTSFKEALKYFILQSRAEPEYYRKNITRDIFNEIQTQYTWYIGQASNSFKIPSPDQMEAMINGLVRILPRAHNHSDGWKSLNKKEGQGYFAPKEDYNE